MTRQIFLALLLSVISVSHTGAQQLSVYTETVGVQDYAPDIVTSGTLVNGSEQALAFKTPGIVNRVTVKEGQTVAAGQLLARLDTDEFEADAAQASALLNESKRALERLQKLYANKVVPLDQVQSAETSVEVAQARLKVARFNLRHATIEAPSRGVILRKLIEPNEIVNGQRVAFVFASQGQGWVIRVGLSDRDVIRIREGDRADIRFDAHPGQVLGGRVHEVAAKASTGTGTFEVEIRLDAPAHLRLLSGMVARAVLHPEAGEKVMRIPLTAVIAARGNEAEVYVLNDRERVENRRIRIGHFDADHVTVLTGLHPGETVVTRGATSLVEGQRVTPGPLLGQN